MPKSTYFKFSLMALALMAAMPCWGQTQPAAPSIPDPVAKVNGQPISRALYEDRLSAYHGVYILEDLIAETMLNAEAVKRGVSVTEQEVTQRVKEMRVRAKPSLENQGSFRSWLISNGITENRYRDQARITLLAEKMFAGEAKVMDAEVAKYYDENKVEFEIKPAAKMWALRTSTEDLAKKALELLKAGKSFQEVAKTFPELIVLVGSPDSPMAIEDIQSLVYPLRSAVEQAALKSPTGPVKVLQDPKDSNSPAIGYLVIRVEERTPGRVKTYAEVKEDIRRNFFNERIFGAGGIWTQWWEREKKSAKIEKLITFTGEPVAEAEKPPAVNPK